MPPAAPLTCSGDPMTTLGIAVPCCMHIIPHNISLLYQPPHPNLMWLPIIKCAGLKCARLHGLLARVDTHCWALDLEVVDL